MFLFPRTRAGQLHLAIAAAGVATVLIWPLTPALADDDARLVRLACAALTVTAAAAFLLAARLIPPAGLTAVAGMSAVAGLGLLVAHVGVGGGCIAIYEGRPLVIGSQLTATGAKYASENAHESNAELLFDAAGQPGLVWTQASITWCRFLVGWAGLLAVPLLTTTVAALAWRRSSALLWTVSPTTVSAAAVSAAASPAAARRAAVYDAFISYRRLDKARAEALAEALESRGFRVAIDFRDFRPNEHVLAEMERCILESRFVLCVITAQYGTSGFTTEEAQMARLLDLIDRRSRIVPLVFEPVAMPTWLHGLVGVNFSAGAQIDPMEKLVALLATAEPSPPTPSILAG